MLHKLYLQNTAKHVPIYPAEKIYYTPFKVAKYLKL